MALYIFTGSTTASACDGSLDIIVIISRLSYSRGGRLHADMCYAVHGCCGQRGGISWTTTSHTRGRPQSHSQGWLFRQIPREAHGEIELGFLGMLETPQRSIEYLFRILCRICAVEWCLILVVFAMLERINSTRCNSFFLFHWFFLLRDLLQSWKNINP